MSKRIGILSTAICLIFLCLSGNMTAQAQPQEAPLRGAWIATVYNIDFPSKQGLTQAQQKQELDAILATAAKTGLNALFFQVRPTADALYQSDIFPWSAVLSGTQGKANDGGFDPLAYLIEKGKEKGIEIHAWINPLRVTTGTTASPQTNVNLLAANHPARLNSSYVVASGGMLYFDPGIPAVRKLIIDGAVELANKYDIAGIHFDDYFYPTSTFDDSASYKSYGSGYSNKSDWRRANIDALIKETGEVLDAVNPDISFGVSPFGIWADKSKNTLGSDTKGGVNTYYDHYADTRKWVKEGYLDYICPQLYWSIGYQNADFEALLNWWSEVCANTGTKLYIGHAVYKVNDGTQSASWLSPDEIPNQLVMAGLNPVVSGSIHYGWSKINANTLGVADAIAGYYAGDGIVPMQEVYPMPAAPANKGLIIAAPANNYKTSGKSISILGSCDPRYPLYFQGNQVTVTESGHFCVYPSLEVGNNTFSFIHQGKTTLFTVVRTVASTGSSAGGSTGSSSASNYTMKKAEFQSGSLYPVTNTIKRAGQTIVFGCTAPAGAKVWVEIGLYKVNLTAQNAVTSSPSLIATKYTGTFTFPTLSGTDKITLLGKPTFIMEYKGERITSTPGNTISVQSADYQRFATVSVPAAVVRTGPSQSYDTRPSLEKGIADRIYGEQNGYYLLRSGLWIAKNDVQVTDDVALPTATLKGIATESNDRNTDIIFALDSKPPYGLTLSGNTLILTIYNTPGIVYAPSDISGSFTVGYQTLSSFDCVYTFTLDKGYFGHSIGYTDKGLVLSIKNPPALSADTALPLQNTKIVLDAGHGGSDPGALGPMGSYGPTEAQINLAITLYTRDYLRARGATVVLTRETDVKVSLDTRSTFIKAQNPDISVSIHANSLAYETNYNTTTGLMTYYTKDFAKSTAAFIQKELIATLGRVDKNARQQNLAVCRIDEVPAILIETGFMSNPDEYEWLSNSDRQKEIGIAIGKAIESWLRENGTIEN